VAAIMLVLVIAIEIVVIIVRVTTQDVPCYRVPTLTPVPTSLSDDLPTLCLKRDCEHGYQSCQDSDVSLAGMTDHLQ
jgi:hypothetical protein